MDKKTFNEHVEMFIGKQREMLRFKGKDYQNDTDALSNFKEIAQASGKTPIEVWHILMHKHMTAINNFVRGRELKCESIESRLLDLANFVLLGSALIEDRTTKIPERFFRGKKEMEEIEKDFRKQVTYQVLDEEDGNYDR